MNVFDVLARATGGPSISKQGARSLILWSYLSGPDPSLLAPYIYPMWTAGATYLPRHWSPNVVTLTGFTLIIVLYSIVWSQCGLDCASAEGFEAFAPWLYPVVAMLMWGYQTADAMDGRQGKRVGMYVHPSTELLTMASMAWSHLSLVFPASPFLGLAETTGGLFTSAACGRYFI